VGKYSTQLGAPGRLRRSTDQRSDDPNPIPVRGPCKKNKKKKKGKKDRKKKKKNREQVGAGGNRGLQVTKGKKGAEKVGR